MLFGLINIKSGRVTKDALLSPSQAARIRELKQAIELNRRAGMTNLVSKLEEELKKEEESGVIHQDSEESSQIKTLKTKLEHLESLQDQEHAGTPTSVTEARKKQIKEIEDEIERIMSRSKDAKDGLTFSDLDLWKRAAQDAGYSIFENKSTRVWTASMNGRDMGEFIEADHSGWLDIISTKDALHADWMKDKNDLSKLARLVNATKDSAILVDKLSELQAQEVARLFDCKYELKGNQIVFSNLKGSEQNQGLISFIKLKGGQVVFVNSVEDALRPWSSKSYDEGYEAARGAFPKGANPYKDFDLIRAWNKGWEDGNKDYQLLSRTKEFVRHGPSYRPRDSEEDFYTEDPLTKKGEEIMGSMKEQYGEKKGEQVFYASKNAGKITGVDAQDEHIGFEKLVEKFKAQGKSQESAEKLAAYIGRKKYGAKRMGQMAHGG